jgi:hypothetical protein
MLTLSSLKENTVYTLFSFLAYVALACLVIALWKPRFCPLKNPSRLKAASFYLGACIVLFILSGLGRSPQTQGEDLPLAVVKDAEKILSGKSLEVAVLAKEKVAVAATGRDRLRVTLSMPENQRGMTQKELTAAIMREAVNYQKESGAPVVMVTLVCQKAENALGEAPLAQAVYIPDGKGFDGSSAVPQWETLRVAKRGFSPDELKYLQLWAKYYRQYQSPAGTQEKELDALISAELGLVPGSVRPFANTLEAVVPAAKE